MSDEDKMSLEQMYVIVLGLIKNGKLYDAELGKTPVVRATFSRYNLMFCEDGIKLFDSFASRDNIEAVIPWESQLGMALCETFLCEPIHVERVPDSKTFLNYREDRPKTMVYLVVSVVYDFEEAKTVVAVRSDLNEAIKVAKETPHYAGATHMAEYYNEVLAVQLDGAVDTDGPKVVWTDRN